MRATIRRSRNAPKASRLPARRGRHSELPNPLREDALQLIHLYAEHGFPKFEPAARRWLVRYLTKGELSTDSTFP
jgi:hypothetical protein